MWSFFKLIYNNLINYQVSIIKCQVSIIIFENDGYTETATYTYTKAETATATWTETKADIEATTATRTTPPQAAEAATRHEQQKHIYRHHHAQTRHSKPPQAPQRPHTARIYKTNTGHGATPKTPYKAISGATGASAAKLTTRKTKRATHTTR